MQRFLGAGILLLILPLSFSLAQEPAKAAKDGKERLLTFDSDKVELQWQDNHWELQAEGVPLKDFGRREADARLALRLIRHLGLNQLGTIGSPRPIVEYWLVDGHAPTGPCLGLHTLPIDLERLHVEAIQQQWCVRDTYRILFNFGSQMEEAKQTAEILRRYAFAQIGYVGQGMPAMIVFLADPTMASTDGTDTLKVSRVATHNRVTGPFKTKESGIENNQDPSQPGLDNHAASIQQPSLKADKGLAGKLPDLAHSNIPAVLPRARQLAEPRSPLLGSVASAERVPFDWRRVEAKKDRQDWKVVSGSYVFANFGNDEHAAKQAAGLIRSYQCTEHCTIGQPKTSFTYFLSNGQAPHGVQLGVGGLTFHASELTVKPVGTEWVLADSSRILMSLGAKSEDAEQALKAIQRYRFDRLIPVGQGPTPAMVFLARGN